MSFSENVAHKYLLRGHTHMEADHIHALIERSIKKQPAMEIVTPWDWEQLIRASGATVFGMEVQDFKNFSILYNSPGSPFKNKKQNTEKELQLFGSKHVLNHLLLFIIKQNSKKKLLKL